MSIGILGEKAGMTTWFDAHGRALAATVIFAPPSRVVQVKRQQTDGYDAVQIGYGRIDEKNLNKPTLGHLKRAGGGLVRVLREFRVSPADAYQPGQEVGLTLFQEGEAVHIAGISKGKGFAGVMKRHGFKGGHDSHGSGGWHRRPGSIGSVRATGKTFKGRRMAGHLGATRVTVKGLRILKIDADANLLVVAGAVPGGKRALLEIHKAA